MKPGWKRMKQALRDGLAIPEEAPSTEESRFIAKVIDKAKTYHLTFPLLAFAEGLRPLTTIASSILISLGPFAEIFFPNKIYAKWITLVGNRENLNRLISALEEQEKIGAS